jgi:RNA polymerase sigma-70 factor (ECF subfamily)
LAKQPSIQQLSDTDLIFKFKESDDNAFVGELFQRYTHLIFGVCYKYLHHAEDSRDASVEIFEHLLIKLKDHEVTNFKSWLYSVAKNHCLMKLRKGKNNVVLKDDFGEFVEWKQDLHLNDVQEKEEQLNGLEKAISRLNEDQKMCIEMFYLQEKSYQEIMKETGFTFKQVKSFVQNGKRNLKVMLSARYESES